MIMMLVRSLRVIAVAATLAGAAAGCRPRGAGPPLPATVPAAQGILFDPGSAPVLGPPKVAPLPPPAVLDFGPRGRVDLAADIHVRFNQPVVSLGDQTLEAGGVQLIIEPKLQGRSRWSTPDLLVFEPEELAPARRYRVSLQPLAAHSGPAVALAQTEPLSWTFETAGPEVEASYPTGDAEPEAWGRREAVIIRLSQPTAIRNLRAQIKVWATPSASKARQPVPVRVAAASRKEAEPLNRSWATAVDEPQAIEAGRLFKIRPVGTWPAGSEVDVVVPAGLQGRLGLVGSASDWKLAFPTPGPLTIETVNCGNADSWREGEQENDDEERGQIIECHGDSFEQTITLRLTSRIAQSQLKYVQILPRPRGLVVTLGNNSLEESQGGDQVILDGRLLAGKTYRIRLAPQMRNTSGYTVGDGTGGRALVRTVVIKESPDLNLSEGGIFPAGTPPLVGVQTRRVKSLRVRAALLDHVQAAQAVGAGNGRGFGRLGKHDEPLLSWGLPLSSVVTKQLVLSPTGPTAWSDLALDLRDLVGAARGAVVVEVEADSLVSAKSVPPPPMRHLFWITDLAPVAFQSPNRLVVKVVRLSDTQPVAGAQIVRYEQATATPLGHTDSNGLLVIERRGDDADTKLAGAVLLVIDPTGGDYKSFRLAGDPTAGGQKVAGLRADERLLFGMLTERDAYRPGEAVDAVAWAAIDTPFAHSGLRALPAGTVARLSLVDWTRNKEIAQQTTAVDANGKLWAKLSIPQETPLGRLKLEADVLGIKNHRFVKLEDFRTPEFEVSARPLRSSVLLGEPAPLLVRATHYSGVPVAIEELAYVARCRGFHYWVPGLEDGFQTGGDKTRASRGWLQRKRLASWTVRQSRSSCRHWSRAQVAVASTCKCRMQVTRSWGPTRR